MASASSSPINASTLYCAVYGHPIRHSASPAMQNAGIGALGLNWRYLAFDVHPDHLPQAIEGAGRMHFVGLNLTVPHKLLAVDLVDVLDESAQTWGAVNTIRFEGKNSSGEWTPVHEFKKDTPREVRAHGFNTDADAITTSLRDELGVQLATAKVLILGAGGAGRVAALKLAAEGVPELFLVNRTLSKADDLAGEIRSRFPDCKVTVGYPKMDVDLLLNATSLGLKENDASPIDDGRYSLKDARAVYDMIYRPAETPLLRCARESGCKVANGLGMLLHQGAKALEIWTGQPAPVGTMRAALEAEVYGH